MVILREYQKEGIRKIFDAWNPDKGNYRSVLFQMPTGTGKTTVFSEIVRRARLKSKLILIVVHRIELVDQIADRLSSFDIDVGIISANNKPEPDKAVQVATIQTLSRRDSPPADIIIIDECHHSKADTYKSVWSIYPDARFLGVTATPARLNGDGFDDLFQVLIPLGQLSYFIKEGFLTRMKHLVCGSPNLSKVKTRMRDYDLNMLKDVMLDNTLMANLVKSYQRYAAGKKTIVFAVDIEHSKKIVERYTKAGIPAEHIDAKTPKEERKSILQKFRNGEILVLSNVDIVSEGFDVPDCEAVQLARPTKSLVLYLQQVGRCMRPAAGKEFGLVLDNAGLWLEHGLSYIDREWSLQGDKKKKEFLAMKRHVGISDAGVLREINYPEEADYLELIEFSDEIERLLIFEDFLQFAKKKNHKMASVLFKYVNYLIEEKALFSNKELSYCHRRLNQFGCSYGKKFWQLIYEQEKKRIEDESKN